MKPSLVTVGVPVYRGWDTVIETLRSVQDQSYAELDVAISIDGNDERSADICRPFLGDSRFHMVVQTERLGWAGNLDTLMRQTRGEFFCYYQQDDLTTPDYFEALVAFAQESPTTAMCFTDMQVFGKHEALIAAPSITGDRLSRFLTQVESMDTAKFRGLVRSDALKATRGILSHPIADFGAELVFLAELALWGDHVHVPGPRYYKRLHEGGTHLKWYDWEAQRKRRAWLHMGARMMEAAALAGRTLEERCYLFLTVLDRLVVPREGRWFFIEAPGDASEQRQLIQDLLDLVASRDSADLVDLLARDWLEIGRFALGHFNLDLD